jgi:nucleotide-binding universal stress UspA family protein
MFEMKTILHPTDFSESSKWAFHLACSLARDHGARLVALHVAPPPVYGLVLAQATEYEELWRTLHKLVRPDLRIPLDYQLRHGHPVHEILRVARDIECDLIVMGMHGRTGLGRILMGSVTEEIVRRAPCPALAVRTPFPASMLVPAAQNCEAGTSAESPVVERVG